MVGFLNFSIGHIRIRAIGRGRRRQKHMSGGMRAGGFENFKGSDQVALHIGARIID